MSDHFVYFPQRGIKRKAEEVLDVEQVGGHEIAPELSRRRKEASLCDACTDADFLSFVEFGTPDQVSRDFETLWQSPTCTCCRLLRQALTYPDEPEWMTHAPNRVGIRCELHIVARDNADYLQRMNLSGSHYLISWKLSTDRSELAKDLAAYSWRNTAKLETTSLQLSSSCNTKARLAMRRKPIGSSLDVEAVKRWIHECDHEHSGWKSNPTSDLLWLANQGCFRVIDVISETIICIDYRARYCALSYVWGQSQTSSCGYHLRTDQEATHLQPQKQQIDLSCKWDKVPVTIKDAVDFMRYIGERYLWVDALCIDQSDMLDKGRVISVMDSIYKCAYLTLIAVSGKDAHCGLNRVREGFTSERPVLLPSNKSNESIALLLRRPNVGEILASSVWNTRGWTFQEHMLSNRCLIFDHNEVIFDCSHRIYREAYELVHNPSYSGDCGKAERNRAHCGKAQTLHDKAILRNSFSVNEYFNFVEAYTRRQLTYPGDRLDAFSAFLRKFHNTRYPTDQPYAESGIPLSFMYYGLNWSMYTEEKFETIRMDSRGSRTLPTWSWISWSGTVATFGAGHRSSDPSKKFQYPLLFMFKDKHNIFAQPNADFTPSKATDTETDELEFVEWPSWSSNDIQLCRPERGGPVTIHMIAKTIEVRISPIRIDLDQSDCTTRVGITIPGTNHTIDNVRVDPKSVLHEDHRRRFVILLWPVYDEKNRFLLLKYMLLRETEEIGVYNRITPYTKTLSNSSRQALAGCCRTRYIKLR